MQAAEGDRVLRIQEELLKLLKEIDEICRHHGITYYLSGGSVIGAIRNEGFLPWDDDVDIFMTRSNWERFLEAFAAERPADRELVCTERFPDYGNPVPRYTNTATTSIYPHMAVTPVPRGLCVDFFLLDPLPNDEDEARRYSDLFAVYAELLCPYFMVNRRTGLDPSPLDIGLYRTYEARMQAEGREGVLHELEQRLFHYDEAECDRYYLRWGVKRVIYPKSVYGEPRWVPFEDMLAPVTTEVFDALRIDYGDGWRIVPDKAHQEIHYPLARDLDVSYAHYVADFEPFLPRDVLRPYVERKQASIAATPSFERSRLGLARLEALRVRRVTERAIAEKAGPQGGLAALVAAHDFSALRDIFSDYYTSQFSGLLRGWAVPVGLNDQTLHAALLPLVMEGDYFKAVDAFVLREREGRPMEGPLAELKHVLDAVRELTLALDYEDFDRAQAVLERSRHLAPECATFVRARLRLALQGGSQSAPSVEADAREALQTRPGDGECMKYLADALVLQDRADEARDWYRRAELSTRDGRVLLAISKSLAAISADTREDEPHADEIAESTPSARVLTPAQRRVVELLGEIDDICRSDSIGYFLSGNTALRAYRFAGFADDSVDVEVVMAPAAAEAFSAAIQATGREDRAVEKVSGGGMFYVDRQSLFLDADALGLEHPGLRVSIAVLRPAGALEQASRARGARALAKLAVGFASAVRRHGVGGLVRIQAPGGKTGPFSSARLFETGRELEFEGRAYPVPGTPDDPSSMETFLTDVGGVNWKRREIKPVRADETHIVGAGLPYADFLSAANVAGLLGTGIRDAVATYKRLDGRAAAWRGHIARYQRLVRRAGDRFELYRLLEPQKTEILRLRDAGDYDALRERLRPFTEAAARNASHRMGLGFDPELLGALVDLLRHDGEGELASAMRLLVPFRHRKAMRFPS